MRQDFRAEDSPALVCDPEQHKIATNSVLSNMFYGDEASNRLFSFRNCFHVANGTESQIFKNQTEYYFLYNLKLKMRF